MLATIAMTQLKNTSEVSSLAKRSHWRRGFFGSGEVMSRKVHGQEVRRRLCWPRERRHGTYAALFGAGWSREAGEDVSSFCKYTDLGSNKSMRKTPEGREPTTSRWMAETGPTFATRRLCNQDVQ